MALVDWDGHGSTDRYGSSRSETERRRVPTRGRFGVLTRVGKGGERCGGGRRTRTRMRQGRGCAGERHGRAEEAERGGRNGAEGKEVRHGGQATVGQFCWVRWGIAGLVGGRSTAQKMKGKLEQIDESSKTSTEITDSVMFFVKTCRLFLVLKIGCIHEAFLRVVAREHDARQFSIWGVR